MLTAYQGVIEDGKLSLPNLLDFQNGTEVLVIISPLPMESIEAQEQRLNSISSEEWEKTFEYFFEINEKYPAEMDITTLSDQELVDIVHEVREQHQ